MILIVGGYCQGKRDFAKRTWNLADTDLANGAECGADEILEKRAVYNLHLFVRRLGETIQPSTELEFFGSRIAALQNKIVISDEVGLGVVPVCGEERRWREAVGRVCCLLAQNADEVYRVNAGIPAKIKG